MDDKDKVDIINQHFDINDIGLKAYAVSSGSACNMCIFSRGYGTGACGSFVENTCRKFGDSIYFVATSDHSKRIPYNKASEKLMQSLINAYSMIQAHE